MNTKLIISESIQLSVDLIALLHPLQCIEFGVFCSDSLFSPTCITTVTENLPNAHLYGRLRGAMTVINPLTNTQKAAKWISFMFVVRISF